MSLFSVCSLGTVGNVVPGGRLQEPESESSHEDNRYEESFTIYLGKNGLCCPVQCFCLSIC